MKSLREMKELLGVEGYNDIAEKAAILNSNLAKYSPEGILFSRKLKENEELKEYTVFAWSSEFQDHSDIASMVIDFQSKGWESEGDTDEEDALSTRVFSEDGEDFWEMMKDLSPKLEKYDKFEKEIKEYFINDLI